MKIITRSQFIIAFFVLVACSRTASAQFIDNASSSGCAADHLSFEVKSTNPLVASIAFSAVPVTTGNLAENRKRWSETSADAPISTPKSGLLAAGLSLVLPGLGEYYVGDQLWRGAIFTVLEAGLWYGRAHWTARGNDSLTAFHAWADSLWTPQLYVKHLDSLLGTVGKSSLVTDPNNFSQINNEEDTLNSLNFPDFTHRLPERGSQQYYELISKYIQFKYGWVDNTSNDPSIFSPDYSRHADMRQTMNYQFQVADEFLYGVILNHVLSAIDAALLAHDHNSAIRLHGELHQSRYPDGTIGYMPTAAIEYHF